MNEKLKLKALKAGLINTKKLGEEGKYYEFYSNLGYIGLFAQMDDALYTFLESELSTYEKSELNAYIGMVVDEEEKEPLVLIGESGKTLTLKDKCNYQGITVSHNHYTRYALNKYGITREKLENEAIKEYDKTYERKNNLLKIERLKLRSISKNKNYILCTFTYYNSLGEEVVVVPSFPLNVLSFLTSSVSDEDTNVYIYDEDVITNTETTQILYAVIIDGTIVAIRRLDGTTLFISDRVVNYGQIIDKDYNTKLVYETYGFTEQELIKEMEREITTRKLVLK